MKFFKVDFGRFTEHHANYYSPEGEMLDFGESSYPPDRETKIEWPNNLCRMLKIAERLSLGLRFLRVDLYNVGEQIYFGETTFYPASGLGQYTPLKADNELGRFLNLTD